MPDGRLLDGYTISSPCEPNGSGELIKANDSQHSRKKMIRFSVIPYLKPV